MSLGMEKVKVVLSDCQEEFLQKMVEVIERTPDFELSGTASSGDDVEQLILDTKPDVVVLDLIMEEMDGLSLLGRLKMGEECPKFILTAPISKEALIREAFSLGVDYFLLKPFHPEILPARIRQMIQNTYENEAETAVAMLENMPILENVSVKAEPREEIADEALQVLISDYLGRMGVPAHIRGYRYLGTAIEMCVKDITIVQRITKTLYPQVAIMYETTPSRVERAIRHAVEVAWNRGPVAEQTEIFGYTINVHKGRPTNSEFIAMLASRIRLQNRR